MDFRSYVEAAKLKTKILEKLDPEAVVRVEGRKITVVTTALPEAVKELARPLRVEVVKPV